MSSGLSGGGDSPRRGGGPAAEEEEEGREGGGGGVVRSLSLTEATEEETESSLRRPADGSILLGLRAEEAEEEKDASPAPPAAEPASGLGLADPCPMTMTETTNSPLSTIMPSCLVSLLTAAAAGALSSPLTLFPLALTCLTSIAAPRMRFMCLSKALKRPSYQPSLVLTRTSLLRCSMMRLPRGGGMLVEEEEEAGTAEAGDGFLLLIIFNLAFSAATGSERKFAKILSKSCKIRKENFYFISW